MKTTDQPLISRRQKAAGPLHHLWQNHGNWWVHYTLHLPDFTAVRVRRNLRTKDLPTAQRLRDEILAGSQPPPQIAIATAA